MQVMPVGTACGAGCGSVSWSFRSAYFGGGRWGRRAGEVVVWEGICSVGGFRMHGGVKVGSRGWNGENRPALYAGNGCSFW